MQLRHYWKRHTTRSHMWCGILCHRVVRSWVYRLPSSGLSVCLCRLCVTKDTVLLFDPAESMWCVFVCVCVTERYCSSFTQQCHNDGFVTLVDGQCSCLCPAGLDSSTGCATTIKQGRCSVCFLIACLSVCHNNQIRHVVPHKRVCLSVC